MGYQSRNYFLKVNFQAKDTNFYKADGLANWVKFDNDISSDAWVKFDKDIYIFRYLFEKYKQLMYIFYLYGGVWVITIKELYSLIYEN